MPAGIPGYLAGGGPPGCKRPGCRRCGRRGSRSLAPPRPAPPCPTRRSRPSAGTRRSRLVITVATLAPAEPHGTSSACIRAATSLTSVLALLRLTTMRRGRCAPGPGSFRRRSFGRPAELPSGPVAPLRIRRERHGVAVESTQSWAGSATAPAIRSPAAAVPRRGPTGPRGRPSRILPGSPNSRVPSSGSTIHTRSARQAGLVVDALLRQDGVAGPGPRQLGHQELVGLPVAGVPQGAGVAALGAQVRRRRPARSARSAARAWSSRAGKCSPPGYEALEP